ncbi:MAG: GtrA family protein [Haliea sp.]|uniref:GtrA family protein n=1 Tax=Haliea sp. TaxID=1932666 RepID=UPI0032F026B1
MTGLRRQAWCFAGIGAVGFLVDAGVLSWLVASQGWGLYSARAISFGLAVTATWYLNRRITFASHARAGRGREYGRYLSTQTIGALINLGVYVSVIAAVPTLASCPVIPLALGSATALLFNFVSARLWVFSHRG